MKWKKVGESMGCKPEVAYFSGGLFNRNIRNALFNLRNLRNYF